MHSDPDLHNAISLHPLPFNFISRTETSTPTRTSFSGGSQPRSPVPRGASTSVDALPAYLEDALSRPHQLEPVSREPDDEECQRRLRYNTRTDPFHLSSKLKTPDEINDIRANTSRKRINGGGCGSLLTNQAAWRSRKLKHFYEAQNENIERLLKPVDAHRADAKKDNDSHALKFRIAVNGSFLANVCLAVLQLYGATTSGSLSLYTTMADALFDPLSNITLILSHRAINRVDARRYPSGKARIETAGNIVFCFLMTAVSFILIAFSIKELVDGAPANGTNDFHLPSVIAVAVAFVTKLCLFLYCFSLRHHYSQIHILWEDHRNDLFINGFGLLTSVGGSKLVWWLDPAGAIVLSVLISVLWLRTAHSEFLLLIGVSADTAMLQHITYLAMTHSTDIVSLDTVRAWHSGPRLIVEVDVVMAADESLQSTHDVAEDLQMKLESLPDVDRAYVHVDYETSHAPEHFLKKEL